MIYLIDDNKHGQMSENYGVDFTQELQNYSDFIVWKSAITIDEIANCALILSCILIHDSFEEPVKSEIIDLAKKQKVPCVVFSNGFTATIFENSLNVTIKKDRMYHNLLPFLEYFKNKGIIDLKLLDFGLDYNKSKAKIIQNRLFYSVLISSKNFDYESIFIDKSEAYKDFKELVHLSNPNKDIEIFFPKFEEDLLNNDVDIIKFKNIIKQLVKNIK